MQTSLQRHCKIRPSRPIPRGKGRIAASPSSHRRSSASELAGMPNKRARGPCGSPGCALPKYHIGVCTAEIASSKTDTTSLPRNPLRATGELVRLTFRGTLGSQGSVRGSVRRLSPRKWLRKLGKRGVTVDAEAVDADDELSQDILGFKANDRDDGASLLG